MRYMALACDYDGTLAEKGQVDRETLDSLRKLTASGRKLILVTGRELDDLISVFPDVQLFDWVVAENGALLYRPTTREQCLLASSPPRGFVETLRSRGVRPLSVGKVIVASWHPNEAIILDVIREMGLELQVVFNKEAVMVLPTGITKATGLVAALLEMKLSPHNVVGIGDAENDLAFLIECECAVAVANALPEVQQAADFVTRAARSAGVRELIDELLRNDLHDRDGFLRRHHFGAEAFGLRPAPGKTERSVPENRS
jgi:HAD superfamily hydrolase (TIGR01484 family)